MKQIAQALCAVAVAFVAADTAAAATLDTVKQRGILNCGANGQIPGFGMPDSQGNWTGLDVDYCRAIAAAIFNDATKVKFVALTARDRFTALQTGDVDVLVRNTTWTSSRDTQLGLNGTGINYYDGQGFMVRKSLKVNSALELNDAAICVQQGTTTELNLADYFRANRMRLNETMMAAATTPQNEPRPPITTTTKAAVMISWPMAGWMEKIGASITPARPASPTPRKATAAM